MALAIKSVFCRMRDPRRRTRRRHLLPNIVAIAICAIITGAKTWEQIALFGREREAWLSRFLDLENGTPSHDTFERLFDRLDPVAFDACFRRWVQSFAADLGIKHIAIDGKSLRGSAGGKEKLGPLHLVSAWATEVNLSLGQVAVDQKSNEITAIPKLLELLDLNGALITIDAMGCQKEIAEKIIEQGGDYVLTVKGNQEKLQSEIQDTLKDVVDNGVEGQDYQTHETEETGHGRHEKRTYTTTTRVDEIDNAEAWKELKVVGMCYSERTEKGKTTTETRYFIGSRQMTAKRYGEVLRNHWRIENNLHWQLDVTMGEDRNRERGRNSAQNLALLRRMALGLLKRHTGKDGLPNKMYRAALSTNFLEEILSA